MLRADLGVYAYHLALLTGDGGRVYAFEAVPHTCRSLRRVLEALGVAERVEVIEKAAGDRTGRIQFAIPRRADGSVRSGRAASVTPNEDSSVSQLTHASTWCDSTMRSHTALTFRSSRSTSRARICLLLRGADRVLACVPADTAHSRSPLGHLPGTD